MYFITRGTVVPSSKRIRLVTDLASWPWIEVTVSLKPLTALRNPITPFPYDRRSAYQQTQISNRDTTCKGKADKAISQQIVVSSSNRFKVKVRLSSDFQGVIIYSPHILRLTVDHDLILAGISSRITDKVVDLTTVLKIGTREIKEATGINRHRSGQLS